MATIKASDGLLQRRNELSLFHKRAVVKLLVYCIPTSLPVTNNVKYYNVTLFKN
jgi:hypothetical protein